MKNGDGEDNKTPVEKRAVSGPSELFAAADQRMTERMMTNFSEYVRTLIREDLDGELPTARAANGKQVAA